MNGITIRPATINDIPTLVHHRRLMWWDMGRRDETALAAMEKSAHQYFPDALRNGGYHGFLAVSAESKIYGGGGIVISAWPGSLYEPKPRRAMIVNMYVEREHRRQGIARLLLQTMVDWCRENDFARVGLHASDEGRPLYDSAGFKPTNEMSLELRPAGKS